MNVLFQPAWRALIRGLIYFCHVNLVAILVPAQPTTAIKVVVSLILGYGVLHLLMLPSTNRANWQYALKLLATATVYAIGIYVMETWGTQQLERWSRNQPLTVIIVACCLMGIWVTDIMLDQRNKRRVQALDAALADSLSLLFPNLQATRRGNTWKISTGFTRWQLILQGRTIAVTCLTPSDSPLPGVWKTFRLANDIPATGRIIAAAMHDQILHVHQP